MHGTLYTNICPLQPNKDTKNEQSGSKKDGRKRWVSPLSIPHLPRRFPWKIREGSQVWRVTSLTPAATTTEATHRAHFPASKRLGDGVSAARGVGLTSHPARDAPQLESEGLTSRGGAKKARPLGGGGAGLKSAASRPGDLEPKRRRRGAFRLSADREPVCSARLRRSLYTEGARGWQLRLKHIER